MNAKQALKVSLDMERAVSMSYLEDLTDQEMMHRPCPGANHIKWQLGHLIASEHALVDKVVPGSMPPLPDGFQETYSREQALVDDAAAFHSKQELLQAAATQREGTLAALDAVSDADLDQPSGVEYAPTVGGIFSMQGGHWLMHAGQWAVIRRQLGRPPLF